MLEKQETRSGKIRKFLEEKKGLPGSLKFHAAQFGQRKAKTTGTGTETILNLPFPDFPFLTTCDCYISIKYIEI